MKFKSPVSLLLLFLSGSAVFFSGCRSLSGTYNPPALYEVNRDRIEENLEKGDITTALQDYYVWLRSEGLDAASVTGSDFVTPSAADDSMGNLYPRLREELLQSFQKSLKEGNYTRAISLYISAEQAGLIDTFKNESLPPYGEESKEELVSLSGLQRLRVLSLLGEGQPVKALAYILQLSDLSFFSGEELNLLFTTALEEKKSSSVMKIVNEMDRRGLFPENGALNLPAAAGRPRADLIRGTVTVWVNRGMKIQEGVGLPDRVIGSGFYIDRRGYVITNYHVIRSQVDPEYEGYSRLFVRPSENPDIRIPARVVGWDSVFDIALLKVETETETVFSFSTEGEHLPGERIYAIGSPAGLENTLTSGIISAVDRRFLQMGNVMQVDVPINQGNSGGPLLDEKGDLIGVVFAGIEQFEGINFAIPVRWLIRIFPKLYDGGQIEHPFLGIALQKVEENMEVTYVLPGSPAHRIGMEVGDILTGLGSSQRPIYSMVEAHDILLSYTPGTLIRLRWIDQEGKEKEGLAALKNRPERPLEQAIRYDRPERLFAPAFGMKVEKIQDNMLGSRYIVKKVYQGSVADETGMSENDPFSIQQWKYMEDEKILLAQIRIKKRKAGFLETGVQLGTYVETNNFL
jgi:S1-C subfamily serine protease